MTVETIAPIKAEVIRITLLDTCGKPVTGTGSAQLVTSGFTRIQNTPNYTEGERFNLRMPVGDPCVAHRDPHLLNWLDQRIDLCAVNPDALVLLAGQDLLGSGSPVTGTGTGVLYGEGLILSRFSLETWQKASGDSACDAAGNQLYLYWAFPHVGDALLQGWVLENGLLTLAVATETRAANPLWTRHVPWLPAPPTLPTGTHWLHNVSTTVPPVETAGAIAFP